MFPLCLILEFRALTRWWQRLPLDEWNVVWWFLLCLSHSVIALFRKMVLSAWWQPRFHVYANRPCELARTRHAMPCSHSPFSAGPRLSHCEILCFLHLIGLRSLSYDFFVICNRESRIWAIYFDTALCISKEKVVLSSFQYFSKRHFPAQLLYQLFYFLVLLERAVKFISWKLLKNELVLFE